MEEEYAIPSSVDSEEYASMQIEHQKDLKFGKPKIAILKEDGLIAAAERIKKSLIEVALKKAYKNYNTSLENVKAAIKKLEAEKVQIKPPHDFMAETFKTDDQMDGVKSRLLKQQVKVQTTEEKKLREQGKKIQKQIKDKMAKSQSQTKRTNLEAIDKWKEEIKEKGEKAKDLSDFMSKNSGDNLNKTQKRGLFKNGSKTTTNGKGRRKAKQGKMKRPGKVARLQFKNKKMSSKGGR